MKEEKIYSVEFLKYTNCMKDAVSCDTDDLHYIDTKEPVLVRESDLDKFKEYGQGFRTITYVGVLKEFEDTSSKNKVDIR